MWAFVKGFDYLNLYFILTFSFNYYFKSNFIFTEKLQEQDKEFLFIIIQISQIWIFNLI